MKQVKKAGKNEHHLWEKRDSASSGQKAFNLVRIVSQLPNEKETVYGALDKWIAWETEFPLIAAAKALRILRKRSQWLRVIQAGSLWNTVLHTHSRSISKRLFSRMISVFDHHSMPNKIIEYSVCEYLYQMKHNYVGSELLEFLKVFADMEELCVRLDENTVKKVVRAFQELGQEDKQKLVLRRYMIKWKYIHFNGEQVRVKRYTSDED
ncbi:hypothetical protein Godav_002235 [Gossypium davidsonii]|uniref:Pentatricopeptide repeat-containing protein n=1 Tax=Gossypium davidsonii TaxID=34287 RepID=A0A7J8SVH7_GOSDV|nr:hypothetical protein [Gossypium davidsonii]